MKKILIGMLLMLLLGLSIADALMFETLSANNSTADTLTLATGHGDRSCTCGPLETTQARFKVTSTQATSVAGHLLEIGQTVGIGEAYGGSENELAAFSVISTGATTATLPCTCW